MDISSHAIKRLYQRFKLDKSHIRNILSILNNPKACKKLPGHKQKHLKFKYIGRYMVAVIKDNNIVTFKYSNGEYRKLQSDKDKRKNKEMKELSTEKTMTVKEVAKILGVTSEAIKWHVRKLFPNSIENGKPTLLTEWQIVDIKEKMIPTSQLVGAKTDIEMISQAAEVMAWFKVKNDELQNKVNKLTEEKKVLEPKAQFYDQVTNSKDAIDIGSASKVLNISQLGRNKLFELLRSNKILMPNNQPYQKYIDLGYFRTIEQKYTKPDGSTHISIKTVVYQKGLDYIRKIVETSR